MPTELQHPQPSNSPALSERNAAAGLRDRIVRRLGWLSSKKAALYLPILAFVILWILVLGVICWWNNGIFIYSLDDAYIHLALAENLAEGHYGINRIEYSAPSSSILWPFLLAPFARHPVGQFVPLLINFLAALGSMVLFNRIVGAALSNLDENKQHLLTGVIVLLLIPATNLIGLAFTGMEHSLQLTLSAMVILGLIRERETKVAPWWLLAAIIIGPLVRYENLALSIPALAYLAFRGYYVSALAAGLLLTLGCGGFSLWLYSHGLGLFPTSILAKSSLVANSGHINELVRNLIENLNLRQGALLCVGLLLFSSVTLNQRRDGADRLIAGWAAVAVALHLVVGQFGWLSRYEIYAWATALLTLIYLFRDSLIQSVKALRMFGGTAVLSLGVLTLCYPYIQATFSTPFHAREVYEPLAIGRVWLKISLPRARGL